MLSNLASYLGLGYSESPRERDVAQGGLPLPPRPALADLPPTNQRLISETEEDDWVVVSKPGEEVAEAEAAGMEESWFVTPPPCFSSTGPVSVETSPLENLLIEHPSMSVYRRRSPSGGSPTIAATAPTVRPAPTVDQENAPPARHQRHDVHRHRHPLHQIVQQQSKMHAAQKQEAKRVTEHLKAAHLEKDNKVREVNGRNRRPRRSDLQKRHSGANNNRKC